MDKPNPLDYEWTADGDMAYRVDLQRWLLEQQDLANQKRDREGLAND
jgi:hypothetical protein